MSNKKIDMRENSLYLGHRDKFDSIQYLHAYLVNTVTYLNIDTA